MTPKRHKVILFIAALWFSLFSIFIGHKSLWLQLAVMVVALPYLVAVLYSLVEVFRSWRNLKVRALIPLIACLAAWYCSGVVGQLIQAQLFVHNLPGYQIIVNSINPNTLAVGVAPESLVLGVEAQKLVYFAAAERIQDGSLIVELLTEGGFPVKHSGYVFSASGIFPKDSFIGKRWPYVREVQPNWFRVSD